MIHFKKFCNSSRTKIESKLNSKYKHFKHIRPQIEASGKWQPDEHVPQRVASARTQLRATQVFECTIDKESQELKCSGSAKEMNEMILSLNCFFIAISIRAELSQVSASITNAGHVGGPKRKFNWWKCPENEPREMSALFSLTHWTRTNSSPGGISHGQPERKCSISSRRSEEKRELVKNY